MKSFLVAATIALVGSSLMADAALAKSKRAGMSGMAGMAAMAPALAEGTALIGSGGFIGGPGVTPYGGPVDTSVAPVIVPDVHVPYIPMGVGLPGTPRHEIGG